MPRPRPLRHLGHPLTSLALIAAVVLDVLVWMRLAPANHHPLARDLGVPFGQSDLAVLPGPIECFLLRDGDGFRVVPREEAEAAAARPHTGPVPVHAATFRNVTIPVHTGLIAPVLSRTPYVLSIAHVRATLTPEEIAAARARVADLLTAHYARHGQTSPIPALLTAGNGTHTEIHTIPLINDLLITPIILLAAASTTLSLTRAVRIHIRRKSPQLCPACGYDRAGLPAHAPCPECGESPGRTAAQARRPGHEPRVHTPAD